MLWVKVMDYEQIKANLARRLTPKRLAHSVGVSETSAWLAEKYGADVRQARLAGLVHDCAREMTSNNLLQLAEAFGIVVNDVERQEPVLLHAPVGAALAEREYGIRDPQILRAIALHTTGGADLTLLDKIIYLADFIEPHRDFPGVDKLRSLARIDLDAAVLAAYDQTLQYIVGRRALLHPATVEGRNQLLIKLK
ncbi:putative HD superfamily hydrolase of NAD metabolism [Sporolituus thermophilus DSM 23256]|uniref:bis(5'-nucleosyl)-tetraphosphatase (symmetrical) n=2 Tax=Sporolituus TaxID=909931 RepID=A0A1G7J9W1_9FIRM|nr:putative HD superfamily hydrolase of NAD metabolism [Sporolituus thermophilus DSM 23256]